jgi:hypothetical protein
LARFGVFESRRTSAIEAENQPLWDSHPQTR